MQLSKALRLVAAVVAFTLLSSGLAWADVSGQFTVDMEMVPQTNTTEISPLLFDVVPRLNLDILLSGLTAELDFATGLAGMEHVVASASATLGAVDLRNDIAFAMPFGSISIGSFTFIRPIGNQLLFVTERLTASASLFGITLTNLLIYEDLNFRHPFSTLPLGNQVNAPKLPTYTAQSQSFAFGDIVTLRGRLNGGALLTLQTGLSADPGKSKTMKRRSFGGAVVPGDSLSFVVETLSVNNLAIGPVDLNTTLRIDRTSGISGWQPSIRANAQVPLQKLGQLRVNVSMDAVNTFPVQFNSASLVFSQAPVTVSASFDNVIDLTGLSISSTFNFSAQASSVLQMNVSPTSGVDTFSLNLIWSDPSGVTFSGGVAAGQGEPTSISASVRARLSSNFQVRSSVRVTPNADTTVISLNSSYSF